jgi:predicted ATPase
LNSLGCKRKINAQELGALIYKKTQGNPFFVNQLLHILHKDGHIRFQEESVISPSESYLENEDESDNEERTGGWVCDLNGIKEAHYTSNVVDMMVGQLSKLPEHARQLLGTAATIGSRFDVLPVGLLCHLSKKELSAQLSIIVQYVYFKECNYCF